MIEATDRHPSRLAAWTAPGVLFPLAAVLAAAAYVLYHAPGNPPGFHHDEASAAYNGYLIGRDGHDEDGRFLPLFFVSYGGYLSPVFPYLLALVFKLTGPSQAVARDVGGVCVLLGILVLGVLAWRLTRDRVVASTVVVLAALTPWLYELSALGIEMTLMPLAVALLLLAVSWAHRSDRSPVLRGGAVGVALAFLTYVYAGGRGNAPLYAAALALFLGRDRWRWVVSAWAAYAVLLVPGLLNLDALTARYDQTRFTRDGMGPLEAVGQFLWNYLRDFDPFRWAYSGDPQPYIHVWGTPQFFASALALTLAGTVLVLPRRDLWWRWVVAATLLTPIPAALTVDRHNSQRMLALPVLFLVLAVPALHALVARMRSRAPLAVAAAVMLVAGVGVQLQTFLHWYGIRGPQRTALFDAGVPGLLSSALDLGRTVYIDHDDRHAQTMAHWYAVTHDIPADQVAVLPDGGVPPAGSLVFGATQACDYRCGTVATAGTYWLARALGPNP